MATSTTVDIHGYALRAIRELAGLSPRKLADEIGTDRSYIARIENGHTVRVSRPVYRKILTALCLTDYRALLANPHGISHEDDEAASA